MARSLALSALGPRTIMTWRSRGRSGHIRFAAAGRGVHAHELQSVERRTPRSPKGLVFGRAIELEPEGRALPQPPPLPSSPSGEAAYPASTKTLESVRAGSHQSRSGWRRHARLESTPSTLFEPRLSSSQDSPDRCSGGGQDGEKKPPPTHRRVLPEVKAVDKHADVVGLGLGDEKDITVNGLEAVKRCERVYLEAYTSVLGVPKERLEALYGREVVVADREFVEQGIDGMLNEALKMDVAFLVRPTPFAIRARNPADEPPHPQVGGGGGGESKIQNRRVPRSPSSEP